MPTQSRQQRTSNNLQTLRSHILMMTRPRPPLARPPLIQILYYNAFNIKKKNVPGFDINMFSQRISGREWMDDGRMDGQPSSLMST